MADVAENVHEQGESKAKENKEHAKKNKKKQVVHKDTNTAIKKGLARMQTADQDDDEEY